MEQKSLLCTGKDITEIYNRQIDTIYRVCFSMTGNQEDAEDAVQTVFLKLMNQPSSHSFNGEDHEKAWLITTARNVCRDLHRQWWRKKVTGMEALGNTPAPSEEPGDQEVWEKMMDLDGKYRVLLYLHYYEGYKLYEIGAMLDLNINTVKARLRTARKKLKLEMGEDYR